MKYFIILILIIFNPTYEDNKLKGKYYVDFEGKLYQNGYIDFKDSIFSMKHFNLLPYTGKIQYSRNDAYLYINSSKDVFFTIRNENLNKDTIKFGVHSKSATPSNYMDISIGGGKFIKLK